MKSRIPQQLILILQLLDLNDVSYSLIFTLFKLVIWSNDEEKLQLFKLGAIDAMLITLDTTDQSIFKCSAIIITNILSVIKQQGLVDEYTNITLTLFQKINKYVLSAGADLVNCGEQHPWFHDLEADGTLQKLINYEFYTQLGILYKAQEPPMTIKQQIIYKIFSTVLFNQRIDLSEEQQLKSLCYLAECKENQSLIIEQRDFKDIFNSDKIKSDTQTYQQLLKLLHLLTDKGTNETKIRIWELIPTPLRVQNPSLSQFYQQQMKKKDISIQNLPSSSLINLATKKDQTMKDNPSLSILTPSEIDSLFIQILALLDFYHRRTCQKEDQQNNHRYISPWLEVKLCFNIVTFTCSSTSSLSTIEYIQWSQKSRAQQCDQYSFVY
ncbi:MAG: hypothetical protein EZS28_021022 [Streblomastix strix]|uniref:Uncharacterized protein n=1 Tax=Streblomastix strix TaxID=222440 RepID=A0A5J4VMF5_9EUKA|nr:MAG: hypothetical protein EZS28_021022 [Streblomastix strix]